MRVDAPTVALARLVTPRALRVYAQALGWQPVEGVNGAILVFHRPDSRLHQLIVPLDEHFDDYGEQVMDAAARLADFEKRPVQEVLDQLLLPSADVLRFCNDAAASAAGTLALEQAADLLSGARKGLLAVAHSVLAPRPYHPRLSRGEAEQFVRACRVGQTERGSYTVSVVCPLDAVPSEAHLFEKQPPFARQVTAALIGTLEELTAAVDGDRVEELLQPNAHPLLSTNLCEALLLMRPDEERASLTVSATWSRSQLPEGGKSLRAVVRLRREDFAAAEYLAPRLRGLPGPHPAWFVGQVDILRGQLGPDDRPFGEVVLAVLHEDEIVRARAELTADEYATAGQAHLSGRPVTFRGVLYRSPRLGRIEQVTDFAVFQPQGAVAQSAPG